MCSSGGRTGQGLPGRRGLGRQPRRAPREQAWGRETAPPARGPGPRTNWAETWRLTRDPGITGTSADASREGWAGTRGDPHGAASVRQRTAPPPPQMRPRCCSHTATPRGVCSQVWLLASEVLLFSGFNRQKATVKRAAWPRAEIFPFYVCVENIVKAK